MVKLRIGRVPKIRWILSIRTPHIVNKSSKKERKPSDAKGVHQKILSFFFMILNWQKISISFEDDVY